MESAKKKMQIKMGVHKRREEKKRRKWVSRVLLRVPQQEGSKERKNNGCPGLNPWVSRVK
jgi:hypothetical protein